MRGTIARGVIAMVALASPFATAQAIKFDTAEISLSAPDTVLIMRKGFTKGRYELRMARLTDLIRTAWGVDEGNVVGGPEWLDQDRFDVIATAPANANEETLRSMLKTLLDERFQLVVRQDTRSLPRYAMTAGKRPQLKRAASAEEKQSGCTIQAGAILQPVIFTCHSEIMADFATYLGEQWPATEYLFNYRVADRTGLKGAWDFTFQCSRPNPNQSASGAITTLFDALENQLGLKLELTRAPTPVVVVESARKPELAKPSARRVEFEVADIRPDEPGPIRSMVAFQPGGRVTVRMTLKGLIWEAWGNVDPTRIIGGPKSMDTTGWVVVAKAQTQEGPVVGWNGVDINAEREMLRSLLIDRFKLQAHTEDRLVDGYALVAGKPAAKPKLKRAAPGNRPGCRNGPGAESRSANWKDPRIENPAASRLVTCQDVTMAQFAARLSTFTTEENPILSNFPPVVDATGIEGSYDLTINFTPPVMAAAGFPGGGPTTDPDGAISIFEALSKQLGLKLEARKVMGKVLVVDHVEEKPTEN